MRYSPGALIGKGMNETGTGARAKMLRIVILATMLSAGHIAVAQDALPSTPPELKDFKLDPEKKPTEPKPEVKTPVIQLPEVKPASPAPAPVAARDKPAAEPKREVAAPKVDKPAVLQEAVPQATATAPLPEPASVVAPDPAQPETGPAPVPSTGAETGFDISKLNWGMIGAALGLAAIALLAGAAWRRRRVSPDNIEDTPDLPLMAHEPQIEPALPEMLAPAFVPELVPDTSPIVKTPAAAKRPELDISFVPEKATVSIANLTINGQLRIINVGKGVAKSMGLRAILISASESQDEVIAAFHGDKAAHFVEHLGEVGAGERIAMDIELSIPLSELRSYPLGDRRLFVPIVLADIEYSWGKTGQDEARLSCLIGREATPPTPKMGPLRLDLGPRSFAPLGQRPVFG